MGKVQKKEREGTENRQSRHNKNDGHCTDDQKKITQSKKIRVYMVENILTYSCKATLIFTN
jgi:hypothetical protein